jgi:hypothetical protein
MNYIPGFSNYLETTVPAYAEGGEVMGDLNLSDADLATLASLNSASASGGLFNQGNYGSDFGSLDNVYGMNFGSDFGSGGSGGSLYKVNPYLQTFQAPLSDKGNPTAYGGGGIEVKSPTQTFRLFDKNTGKVVYEGVGYEGAQEAIARAGALTAEGGTKAQWEIQTPNSQQESGYSVVANEKRTQSTAGDIIGTALPLAAMFVPGLGPLGSIALGSILGGAGAAIKGDDPLKGIAMGGLSSAGGQLLGPVLGDVGNMGLRAGTAIGTGIGSTAGGLVTGQNLENALIGGALSGGLSYLTPDITKALGGGAPASTSTSGDGGVDTSANFGGPNAEIIVNAPSFSTPNINLGSYKTPEQKYLDDAANDDIINPETRAPYYTGYDGDIINVTGSVPGAVTGGLNLGDLTANPVVNGVDQVTDEIVVTGTRPDAVTDSAVTGGLNLGDLTANPATNATDEIVVTGTRPDAVTDSAVTGGLNLVGGTPADGVAEDTDTTPDEKKEDIVVTGSETTNPGGLTLADDVLKDIDELSDEERKVEEEEEAKKKLGLEEYLRLLALGVGALGGGGGSGSPGTYVPGGRGLNPIFSAQLPAAGGLGTIGANRTARPLGDVDWLTYGERPELKFFDYSTPATRAPITSPIPDEPAGPSMYAPDVDDMRFARGGAMPARRGGAPKRAEFAVNGPGTGRSDDIPAVLSDGEYVIDAETVALLGDGSSKAGAKKLDDLRVKVRKHKGKKLAKGRFSANAKKPEAYLSGGRI